MNETLATALLLSGGLAALLAGAELLVRGASRLAAAFGIPPLVIGLTVVAYGTSAPELAVSLRAAAAGQADIAVGNAVGSNIFNVLFVLGLSALITPLAIERKLVRLDVPIMVFVTVLFALAAWNGRLGRLEGLAFVALGAAYTVFQVVAGRRSDAGPAARANEGRGTGTVVSAVLVGAGLVLLTLGSRWLVDGAVALARAFGTSELVIGLTVVAAGTSLPELATSLVASLRGERAIAVGNIVGSNVFNLLWVLGLAAALSADGVAVTASARRFDIPVMVVVALACLPIFFSGNRIARWEGALFFAYYFAYTAFLVLATSQHEALGAFKAGMTYFALPLTAITFAVITWRAVSGRGGRPQT